MTKKALVFALLAFVPLAQGHASPTPLDNEVQILADEASDNFAYYDGFDIQDLYLREAVLRATGEPGIIVRPIIYGGFGPAAVATTMNLDLSFMAGDNPFAIRLSTEDGQHWTGANVVETSMGETETGVGVQGTLQVFISYAEMGVDIGDSLSEFTLVSLADEDPRDQSPGGYFAPGTGGEVEIPGDGRRATESYELIGNHGYTESTIVTQGDLLVVNVTNLITVIGQHVQVEFPEAEGWEFTRVDANAVSAEPGQHPSFTFRATSDASANMTTVAVTTDLHGRELLALHPAHHEDSPIPPATDEVKAEDTPAPLLLLPLLAALLLRRR